MHADIAGTRKYVGGRKYVPVSNIGLVFYKWAFALHLHERLKARSKLISSASLVLQERRTLFSEDFGIEETCSFRSNELMHKRRL